MTDGRRSEERASALPLNPPPPGLSLTLALLLGYFLAWLLVLWVESSAWPRLWHHPGQILAYFVNAGHGGGSFDTTWMIPLLVLAPAAWLVRRRPVLDRRNLTSAPAEGPAEITPFLRHSSLRTYNRTQATALLGLGVFILGIATAAAVGWSIGPLPPSFHDEYSYLFQARTFLAGHLCFPSHRLAAFFDQVHVLNDGHFASRYFPGTGLWLAPFVRMGRPYWGYWLASGLSAVLTYAAGLELLPMAAACLAGALVAIAPAVPIFGNLLLGHHPTLIGQGVFLLFFLRGRRTGSIFDEALAGLGIGYALLCRPLTAFGVGLPFAVYMLAQTWNGRTSLRHRLIRLFALILPFGVCIASLLPYNRAITGSPWQTPYALYNRLYTPRNVYGFYNVQRGSFRLGPQVLKSYDAEAKDLQPFTARDPSRQVSAVDNAFYRIVSMAQSTLGTIPLMILGIVLLVSLPWKRDPWWLLTLALLSLHVVHLPYYYTGIYYWHYVFESVPLICLLAAGVTSDVAAAWRCSGRWLMTPIWLAMLVVGIGTCWVDRGQSMINQMQFSRGQFARFDRRLALTGADRNSLVFIADDPSVHHIGFVVNRPDLSGPVVRAHDRGAALDAALMGDFPGRHVFLYVQKTGQLIRLPEPPADSFPASAIQFGAD